MKRTILSPALLSVIVGLSASLSLGAQSAALPSPILAPTQAYSTFHPNEVIRFSWSAVAGASTYVLQASTDPSFPPGATIKFDNIPSPSFSFAIGNPEGNYSARVVAVDANGVSSAPSNVITFSVFYNNPIGPAPTLASPASGATLTLPITVTWNHVPNPQPSGYELQIARDSSFSSIEDDSPQLNGPSRTVLSLTAGTKFWRVRSFQGDTSPSTAAATAWSAARSFVVPAGPPRPVSITVTKDPLFPGESAWAQVQLTNAVGSSGGTVAITSSNPSILPVPATLSMPANTAWAQFMVTASQQVSDATPVTLTATINSATTSQAVSVQPASLKSLQMSPGIVPGGDWTTVFVNLNGAAPAGGAVVTLASDNQAAVPPTTVTVPEGFFSGSAWVQTNPVAAATTATLTGTYKGASAQTTLSLRPRRQPTSLTLNPSATTNGSIGTIRVGSTAGYDEWFAVTTSNAAVASVSGGGVYLRAGMTSVNVQIATTAVTAATPVTISTSNGGATQSATLTVNPSGAASPTLSSFSVNPTSVAGGTSSTGTVRLSSAAPAGGTVVSLGSNLPGAASVPSTVTVPAGATSAAFTITTFPVDTTTVQLSAGVNSNFLFAALTITGGSSTPPPSSGGPYTLSVTASGRSGDRVTSNPTGINVTVGTTGSGSFAGGTTITLSVASGRDAIWSGACSSSGSKRRSCSFTIKGTASVTANIQ